MDSDQIFKRTDSTEVGYFLLGKGMFLYVMCLSLLPFLCRGYIINFVSHGRRCYTRSSAIRMQQKERLLTSQIVISNITNIIEDKIQIASLLVDGYTESSSNFIILKILEKWNLEYLIKERFNQQQNAMITARVGTGKNIVGYVEVGMSYIEQNDLLGKVPTIGNLVVSPDMRRKGIGRRLMDEVIHVAKDVWQKDAVWLCVEHNNIEAVKLYVDSLGFKQECSYFKEIPFSFDKKREILVLCKKF